MDTSPLSIKLLLHCLLCTIMFKYVICNGNIHCNEKDMNTLLLFKQGLTDPSGLLSSWFPKSDYEVDKSNCLTGELNLSLLELEFLSYLDLSNNDFKSIQHKMGGQKCDDLSRGNLPYHCRNSTNLRYLNLSHNYDLLVDNLHWISRLSSLQDLDLGVVFVFLRKLIGFN
ncbi:hypothetical protein Fmac_023652 [Flemingia macrophylla]|uniref:Leucine-rich repeat-containing N-terminal plant-type domain-containing protein n=1 Tax=Flemingia macrophylla TaxID=520843 RepID=A0ABD1LM49_9FABA